MQGPRTPEAVEAAFLHTLFDQAEQAREAFRARGAYPPRSVAGGVRGMAAHLGLSEREAARRLDDSALYQCFLPSALAADPRNFTETAARLPASAAIVREKMAGLKAHPQFMVLVFHMSGMPCVGMLASEVCSTLYGGPRHCLIAPRNAAWLNHEKSRWLSGRVEMVVADRPGLRRLVAGLRDGTVLRLAAMIDGPQPPGRPGVHALAGVSPALGFRTGILRCVLELGIPVLPLAHWWDSGRLALEWGPLLRDPGDGVDTVAGIIEDLLRRRPEQWLNWTAASLRT